PDDVNVRIIEGDDKTRKIQMRLDLGLLQMEFSGRPDGKRPHGFESFLEYYQHQLKEHVQENGDDSGFSLDSDECAALKSESIQYYYRYLSLFHLLEYQAVMRDTQRNLQAYDFIKMYAENEDDRYMLEKYRPYVIMMHTRSAAHLFLEKNQPNEAIELIEDALEQIEVFYSELQRPDLVEKCNEIHFLNQFAEEIRHQWEDDPVGALRIQMQEAVKREDYKTAAKIRDEIRRLIEIQ
ncbi:MAG: UvrB/UvrC motif-containing protein, partial [Candidatus Omnitrophica bacterium]|nr:UvrB/UvrC motif-containing protein [Candidatus Omnitrophota bacterium]